MDSSCCSHFDDCQLWQLLEVSKKLSAPFELDELLTHVVESGRHVLEADRGTVFLFDREHNELFSKVATGEREIRFPAERGIAGQCAQTRQIINVPDAYADERFNPEIDRKTGYRTRCILAIPLIGFDDDLVGVLQVINKCQGQFERRDEQIAIALGAQCAVALQRARLIDEYVVKQRMERDLALAHDIQTRVLPTELPRLPGYDIAAWSKPAEETGGDIYDAMSSDGEQALVLLGDATGHGIGPALSVTQFRAMFRIAVRLKADLDAALAHINAQMVADLPANRFVTAFLGVVDAARHELNYHAAGQGPLLHYHADTGECEWLQASTFPLGIMDPMNFTSPQAISLARGDVVGLISDGIFEYQDASGEQFGEQRTGQVVCGNADRPISELIEKLRAAVAEFAGDAPQVDDMTIMFIRREK